MSTIITTFLTLSIFLFIFHQAEPFLNKKYKQMKQKAQNYYRKKFGKDKSWHFLGHDATEYPGTHEEFRDLNQEKWDNYYQCLKAQYNNLGEHRSVTPEAVQGFEGGSITLECRICLSPIESAQTDSIEWWWAALNIESLEPVEFTEHILMSPIEKSLQMYNLQPEQTGQYLCSLGNALTAPYFLTVISSSTNISAVHSQNAPHEPHEKGEENIEYSLLLYTEWGAWSPCSKCSNVGKKHRMGSCTVLLKDSEKQNPVFEANTNDTVTSITKSKPETNKTTETATTMTSNITLSAKELELLRIFSFGIPCRSHVLPETIKNLPRIKSRLDEIMLGYCKVKCPEQKIFEVKDKNGNIIEKANNSAGIYSMLQGLPSVEPSVERRLQYENRDEPVALSCPGNLNTDTPVQWQVGSKNVVPELLTKESHGRMYISVMDKFMIKKVKVSDSNVYSCWQNNELAGAIRLVVEKKLKMHFNHHLMLFGMVIILSTFLYVFVKAFFGRKYAKP